MLDIVWFTVDLVLTLVEMIAWALGALFKSFN